MTREPADLIELERLLLLERYGRLHPEYQPTVHERRAGLGRKYYLDDQQAAEDTNPAHGGDAA